MRNQDVQQEHTASQEDETFLNSLDESEIEKRHQFQMFPTPDEKFASKVITELED